MEVVIIDAATFNRMLAGFGELAEKVERLCREHADMGDMQWLDSGDVCRLLDISPGHCRQCVRTARCRSAVYVTRSITGRRMYGASCRWWISGAGLPAAGAKESELVTIKTNDIWKATTSGCCQQAAIRV